MAISSQRTSATKSAISGRHPLPLQIAANIAKLPDLLLSMSAPCSNNRINENENGAGAGSFSLRAGAATMNSSSIPLRRPAKFPTVRGKCL
jgi:hypothetical protein